MNAVWTRIDIVFACMIFQQPDSQVFQVILTWKNDIFHCLIWHCIFQECKSNVKQGHNVPIKLEWAQQLV
jgi:hypothetical protein